MTEFIINPPSQPRCSVHPELTLPCGIVGCPNNPCGRPLPTTAEIDADVRLARDLKKARKQVKASITVLEDLERHPTMKAEIVAMLDQLKRARVQLTRAYCEVQERMRSRLPLRKDALDA